MTQNINESIQINKYTTMMVSSIFPMEIDRFQQYKFKLRQRILYISQKRRYHVSHKNDLFPTVSMLRHTIGNEA